MCSTVPVEVYTPAVGVFDIGYPEAGGRKPISIKQSRLILFILNDLHNIHAAAAAWFLLVIYKFLIVASTPVNPN